MIADRNTYLADVSQIMRTPWPENRTVNIVCHGHSVPAGYFATPMVDSVNAYPHLLHLGLKHRYPFAVINVIVTAIGGENSESGGARFEKDVLCHQPDIVTIDYGLNDRGIGLDKAESRWRLMIEAALERKCKVLLLTPTMDSTQLPESSADERRPLLEQVEQIRRLADEYVVGLVDSFAAFEQYLVAGDLRDLSSWSNHPNRAGHELVVREILRWFAAA